MCAAFTLVELLVVMAIIGIVISLLLPAVQAARESGRRAQCSNNLKQMALACLQHEQNQKILPTGGWGWNWTGDPDRGFNRQQPGGWLFNILPFMEEMTTRLQGAGGNQAGRNQTTVTTVAAFMCPTRRALKLYPYTHGNDFYNANAPAYIARSDYAGNAGDNLGTTCVWAGPGSLSVGDGMQLSDWYANNAGCVPTDNQGGIDATGVLFMISEIKLADIKDGVSNTYLIGERYLDPDNYEDGSACDNDQGWDMGFDFDVNRWTNPSSPPLQDTGGLGGCMASFGSAHAGTFNMALCDGSVRAIAYTIDLETHRRLGNRVDRLPIDASRF